MMRASLASELVAEDNVPVEGTDGQLEDSDEVF